MNDELICRGCGKSEDISGWNSKKDAIKYHEWSRADFYGIFTGIYCNECYENNYPYRKDRYPTMEHDGYGDYLNEQE
jgi:hypothetical protein